MKRTLAAFAALTMMSATAAVAQPATEAAEPADPATAECVWLEAERDRKVARADYYKAEARALGPVATEPPEEGGIGWAENPDKRHSRLTSEDRRRMLLAERRDAFKRFLDDEADERTKRKALLRENPDIEDRDLDDYFGNVLEGIRDRCDNGKAGR